MVPGKDHVRRIHIQVLFGGSPEDSVSAAWKTDQKAVNLRERAMLWKMGFGYGEPHGYGSAEAGQGCDGGADHIPAAEVECAELQGGPVSQWEPADVDLKDAGLIVADDFQKARISFALIIVIFIYITNTGIHSIPLVLSLLSLVYSANRRKRTGEGC